LIQIKQVLFRSISLSTGSRECPLENSSRAETIRLARIAITLIAVLTATDARALVLTLFRDEDQAQRHCPGDTVVWLDFKKRRYYFSSQKLYGTGFHGSFVCLQEARRSLYRRSLPGLRQGVIRKSVKRFPSRQTRSVCAEIMPKQGAKSAMSIYPDVIALWIALEKRQRQMDHLRVRATPGPEAEFAEHLAHRDVLR
jgi:hypothetical protein